MATTLRAVDALPEVDLAAAIEHELQHNCYRNPTKRAALRIARDFSSPYFPDNATAVETLFRIQRLARSLARSGYVHDSLRRRFSLLEQSADL